MTNQEAINTLNSIKQYYNDKNEDSYVGFDNDDNEALDLAIKALKQQPKIGEWIGGSICSRCNYKKMPLWQYKHCPNCGSKNSDNEEDKEC